MTEHVIQVLGMPAPQGSKRHVGHGVMVESSKKVGPWREAVVASCLTFGIAGLRIDDPVHVSIHFLMPRPKHHYRANGELKPTAPFVVSGKPDIDKLTRSTLDGLVQAGAITDDSRVASLAAVKHYTIRTPCAWIRIEPITQELECTHD